MTEIDYATLINWVVSGLFGVIFGAISGWIAYGYQRRRDDIIWKRERELERRKLLRDELTKGLDNPDKAIQALMALKDRQKPIDPFNGALKVRVTDAASSSFEELRLHIEKENEERKYRRMVLEKIINLISIEE